MTDRGSRGGSGVVVGLLVVVEESAALSQSHKETTSDVS